VSRHALLILQLFLQLIEEAPVGALGDELLRTRRDHPDLVQAQGPAPIRSPPKPPDEEHLRRLKQAVEAWNAWRNVAYPDLAAEI
jgi:hypothetical protein